VCVCACVCVCVCVCLCVLTEPTLSPASLQPRRPSVCSGHSLPRLCPGQDQTRVMFKNWAEWMDASGYYITPTSPSFSVCVHWSNAKRPPALLSSSPSSFPPCPTPPTTPHPPPCLHIVLEFRVLLFSKHKCLACDGKGQCRDGMIRDQGAGVSSCTGEKLTVM